MYRKAPYAKPTRAALSGIGACAALALLLVWLTSSESQALGVGTDPRIDTITVTASLPISDTHPGDGVTKTVYYSSAVPGAITLTFGISGTPGLTLTTGAAFGEPPRTYTATLSPWSQVVTYSVSAEGGGYVGVSYTAISTDTNQVSMAIDYVRDVTAPTAAILNPTSTHLSGTQVVITGTAYDHSGGSGVQQVEVTTGTTWVVASGTSPWAYTWHLPTADSVPYTIAVRARDYLHTLQSPSATRAITVDNVSPPNPAVITTTDGTVAGTWIPRTSVPISWTPVTDGSGTIYHYGWDQNGGSSLDQSSSSTTAPSVTATGFVHGDNWFHLRTRDGVGNWTANTAHLGPFRVDLVTPTVTLQSPGAVLTTTHQPDVLITGTAADVGSGLAYVEVYTGAGWTLATGLSSWVYTWTLPIVDSAPYTLSARAVDNVGYVSSIAQIAVSVDTVRPTMSAPVPDRSPWTSSTVDYTWTPSGDAGGILAYHLQVTNTQGYSATFRTLQPSLTFTFTEAYSQQVDHLARLRATDGNGNLGPWSPHGAAVAPDLVPPQITLPDILETSDYLYVSGLTLFYSSTNPFDRFTVGGNASDNLSGLDHATFTLAFGDKPPDDLYPVVFTGDYYIPSGSTANGVITATVFDEVGNSSVQTYTYELDATPPESTAVSPAYATSSPIAVTWIATDTQSGTGSLTLWYRKETTGTWTAYQTIGPATDTFYFVPPEGGGVYSFACLSIDNVQNPETGTLTVETQTLYDTETPQSEATWAPQYSNSSAITVTWVATPSLATLSEVRLWYRVDQGTWHSTTVTSAASSGVFTYVLSEGDGTYEFSTVALDEADKSEEQPYHTGDATTVYDTNIGPVTGPLGDPATWSNANSYTLTWSNPADLSGIAGAYYRTGSPPSSPQDGTWVPGQGRQQIVGLALPSEGTNTVWVWVADNAGNVDHTTARSETLRYDATIEAPQNLSASPSNWTSVNSFALSWSNPTDLSGIMGAFYKVGADPSGPVDGTWVPGGDLESISGIVVGGDGEHTVHLWLGDAAGNADHQSRRLVNVRYDATPPYSVQVLAPVQTIDPVFTVSWAAADAASGIDYYTVAYSSTADDQWHNLLPATTQTSLQFTAPVTDAHYVFLVTAHDRAGNSAQGHTTTFVGTYYVYLPILLRQYASWYQYDVYEPNDTPPQAYGPLDLDRVYESYIWTTYDPDDYFYFVSPNTAQTRIDLTNIPAGRDYDLYVYLQNGSNYQLVAYSNRSGNASENVQLAPVAYGQYYVRVHPYSGFSSQQAYRLRIWHP